MRQLSEGERSFTPANILDAHLATILERTKLFHQALDAPATGPSPVPLLAFAGDCDETLHAALVYYDPKMNRWVTLTSPKDVRASDGSKINRPH